MDRVFLVMYLLPSGIWLWGAMFLNPGSLPSSVHEEQWKRLINRDMRETNEIIREHTTLFNYMPPIMGNPVKVIFELFSFTYYHLAIYPLDCSFDWIFLQIFALGLHLGEL